MLLGISIMDDIRWTTRTEDLEDSTVEEGLVNLVLSGDLASMAPLLLYRGWSKLFNWLRLDTFWIPAAIRLAAIITCELGVSAFQWTLGRMEPIIIQADGESILGLISTDIARSASSHQFFLTQADKEDYVVDRFLLLARELDASPEIYKVGLVATRCMLLTRINDDGVQVPTLWAAEIQKGRLYDISL